MDPSPFIRSTFWTILIGHGFLWILSGTDPTSVQRFLALPNRKAMRNAMFIMFIGVTILISSNLFIGLLIYAYYESCDPLTSGSIEKVDQIVPYFLLDLLGKYPGIPGLFVAAIFSAALSTMSSCWNTTAGIIYQDFVQPLRPNSSERWGSNAMKIIVIVLGFLTIGLVFVVEKMGSVVSIINSLLGATSGIILGIFIFGMLFRNGNSMVRMRNFIAE